MILPGWNSLKTVTTLHAFFEKAGIWALFVLGFCEVLSLQYGQRKNDLVLSPRFLTVQQQQRITSVMKPFKGLRAVMGAVPASQRNTTFVNQLSDVLKAAEVDAFINLPGVEASVSPTGLSSRGTLPTEGFPEGVVISYVTGNGRGRAFAETLAQALNKAEISALARGGRDDGSMDRWLKEAGNTRNDKQYEVVTIVVGDKP